MCERAEGAIGEGGDQLGIHICTPARYNHPLRHDDDRQAVASALFLMFPRVRTAVTQ
jgi:hypothetical protein